MSGLKIDEIASGLERFPGKYDAIDVYVKDVDVDPAQLGTTITLDGNRRYRLELKPEFGVLRLRRDESSTGSGALIGAVVGGTIGLAASKKPEAILGATVLGMLVGTVLFPDEAQSPRQVLTMKFDPLRRTWRAYSGSLVPTMKEQLGHVG